MATCPARLYFKKLSRQGLIEEDPSLPAIFGSAAHKGIEERLKHGTDPYEAAAIYLEENLFQKHKNLLQYADQIQSRREHMEKCIETFEREFYPNLKDKVKPDNIEVKVEIPYRKGKLVGVIDVINTVNGDTFFADWKTGLKIPSYATLAVNPQGGFYYLLAKESDGLIPVPKQFVYVYLTGKNQARTATKTGKNVGKPRVDTQNPMMQYSFPVEWNDAKLEQLQRNYLDPLAAAYESGIVYKNPSEFNCGTCQYRSACDKTDLPKIV